MLVKICGIRTIEQALAAIAAGADLLGLVFAPSKRQLTAEEALPIAAAVHAGSRVPVVGLFVNTAPAEIRSIIARVGLDMVQLSGDEALPAVDLGVPVLKSLRLQGGANESAWREALRTAAQQRVGDGLPSMTGLVDAHVAGAYGGTGAQADWVAAAELARELPILLAGGLHPGNVGEAVRRVRPYGVDVSSGVERDGIKDAALMTAFVRAVREAGHG